jgi:hypothetical protein
MRIELVRRGFHIESLGEGNRVANWLARMQSGNFYSARSRDFAEHIIAKKKRQRGAASHWMLEVFIFLECRNPH